MNDPRTLIAQSPMTHQQVLAIGLCILLSALDGFDVLSISFAAPGIALEWGIDRGALGVVLSMELIGMAFGSVLLGQLADRIGRRPTAIGCLAVMAFGMLSTTYVGSIHELAATRLFTGFGIGGMLATTNALVAEYANDKWRSAAVAMMAAGYPVGGIVGGAVASYLLKNGEWRDVFYLGALITALCLPLVSLLAPEPVGSLLHRRPANTLAKVNRSMRALGHPEIRETPPVDPKAPRAHISELFRPGLAKVTILLTAGYFLHVLTFYFILKWVPKIVVDMGFSAAAAGGVLVWVNVGGLAGSLLFSLMALRRPLRGLLLLAMAASVVLMNVFGQSQADLSQLSLTAAAAGFCTNAGMVGLYALIAASFPTSVRAGGTGFVIGAGRGGAALSPVIAGYLFSSGLGLGTVAMVMSAGSLLAAFALLALPNSSERTR